MNGIEDRLRDAYGSAAQTVRPEQVPAPPWTREQATRHTRPARRLAWRRLAPVAAAAAVVLVAVGSAVLVPHLSGGTRTAPVPSTPTGTAPKYMVIATTVNGSRGAWQTAPLQVQDAATGRVVATVRAPRTGTAWGAAVAVTGNTFILAAEPESGPEPGACYTLLYKLTLTASGTPASLTPLDVPRISGYVAYNDLAASANGMVAYSSVQCPSSVLGTTTIAVIDTATAQTTRWTMPTASFVTGGLALSADGRVLALGVPDSNVLTGSGSAHTAVPAVWVLQTDSAPGSIAQRARQAVTLSGESELTGSLVISADGSMVYVVTNYQQTARQLASRIAAYDVATGALIRVVRTGWHLMISGINADPGVDHAVVWGGYFTEPVEIDLATGQVHTPAGSLPHGFATTAVAW